MRTIPIALVLATMAVPTLADDRPAQPVLNELPPGACLSVWPVDGQAPPQGQAWVIADGSVIQADIHGLEGETYFQRCEKGQLSKAFREDGSTIQ